MHMIDMKLPRRASLLAGAIFLLIAALALGLAHLLTAAPAYAAAGAGTPPKGEGDAPLHVVSAPNGNFTTARNRMIDTVVVHFISGINVDRSRWDDPQLAMQILRDYHVSAHYLVARDGTVYKLVDEKNVAWHAGGSIMPAPDNRRNVNRFSIGIETIATRDSGFTDAQYRSLAAVIRGIKGRYPIRHLVGHDQIGGTRAVQLGLRKDVKPDPGPNFDWQRLRDML